jgi:tRNA 2-thiouridine synthesizing protein A
MEELDLRGLRCPLVTVKARAALGSAGLVVLATDREAPIDLAALAADRDMAFSCVREDDAWRMTFAPHRA